MGNKKTRRWNAGSRYRLGHHTGWLRWAAAGMSDILRSNDMAKCLATPYIIV